MTENLPHIKQKAPAEQKPFCRPGKAQSTATIKALLGKKSTYDAAKFPCRQSFREPL